MFWLLLFSTVNSPAQQPARKINPEPLERPLPLVIVENGDPTAMLATVSAKLKARGFSIVSSDSKAFIVEARKYYDQKRPKDYDRVIIWAARDIAAPDDIAVYLLYGRYNFIVGGTNRVTRIVLEEGKEDETIGALKRELTEALTALGKQK